MTRGKEIRIREVENGLIFSWFDKLGEQHEKICLNTSALDQWIRAYFGPRFELGKPDSDAANASAG